MKKYCISIFTVLFLSLNAHAQLKKMYQQAKQAVTGEAKISQLHYFLKPWEVQVGVGYGYTKMDMLLKGGGTTYMDFSSVQSKVTTGLAVGVFDSLYVSAKWDYLVGSATDYDIPVNTPSIKSTGPEEPVLAAVYRLLDGDSFKVNVQGEFQPSFGESQQADSTNDGDALNGGHEISAVAQAIALITDSSQLSVEMKYTLIGESTSVDQVTNQKDVDSEHHQITFEGKTLTEIANDLFFGVGLTLVNSNGYTTKNQTTLQTLDYGSTTATSMSLLGRYELTPDDSFGADFNYILNYTSDIEGADLGVEGWNLAGSYIHRF